MNPLNQEILEYLRSGEKTAGEIKDAFDCSYSVLDQVLRDLTKANKIEAGWSDDKYPARIYRLK